MVYAVHLRRRYDPFDFCQSMPLLYVAHIPEAVDAWNQRSATAFLFALLSTPEATLRGVSRLFFFIGKT